eukprot:1315361-Amorphochlora_amoeboformis.AAC.1
MHPHTSYRDRRRGSPGGRRPEILRRFLEISRYLSPGIREESRGDFRGFGSGKRSAGGGGVGD